MSNQVPIGTIVMHTGTSLPHGWAYCRGGQITLTHLKGLTNDLRVAQESFQQLKNVLGHNCQLPDLRDKFLFGSNGANTNSHGSPSQHKHQVNIPALTVNTTTDGRHSHRFPAHWYTRGFEKFLGAFEGADVNGNNIHHRVLEAAGGHHHRVTVKVSPFNTPPSTGENRPAWYAVHFIMKVLRN